MLCPARSTTAQPHRTRWPTSLIFYARAARLRRAAPFVARAPGAHSCFAGSDAGSLLCVCSRGVAFMNIRCDRNAVSFGDSVCVLRICSSAISVIFTRTKYCYTHAQFIYQTRGLYNNLFARPPFRVIRLLWRYLSLCILLVCSSTVAVTLWLCAN